MFEGNTFSAYIDKVNNEDRLIFRKNDVPLFWFTMEYLETFFLMNGYKLEKVDKNECKKM